MFVEVEVVQTIAWNGLDADDKPILDRQPPTPPVRKLVALSRIQSVSEEYVLVSTGFGRYAYWAYAGGYEAFKSRLLTAAQTASA